MSGHVDVELSSAYVIINLQTWVLLLDYLGIGIPTPPPSPSNLQEEEEEKEEIEEEEEVKEVSDNGMASHQTGLESGLNMATSGRSVYLNTGQTGLNADLNDNSLYVSAWQDLSDSFSGSSTWASREPSSASTLDKELKSAATVTEEGSVWGSEGKASMNLSLRVRSLTVTFNKPEHPLAQGVVNSLVARVESRQGNLKLSGSLGQASVVDLTETGAYYRER